MISRVQADGSIALELFPTIFDNLNLGGIAFSDGINPIAPPTPLPGAFPLFATGVGALGLLGWRRKRRVAALAA